MTRAPWAVRELLLAALLGLMAQATEAQAFVQPAAGVTAQLVRWQSEVPGETVLVSGPAFGVEGGLMIGRLVHLDVDYLQGTLHGTNGSAATRDLVEGRASLGLAPQSWFAVNVGPLVRTLVAPGGTERWVRWEIGARVAAPIAGPELSGYVEGSWVFAAAVDIPDPFVRGQGGAAGLALRLPRSLGWARLAYSVDRVALQGRRETLESVLLVIGVGHR
jgi:hypothetical protein